MATRLAAVLLARVYGAPRPAAGRNAESVSADVRSSALQKIDDGTQSTLLIKGHTYEGGAYFCIPHR